LVGPDESGPYAAHHEWVNEYFLGMNELGGDPTMVAASIVAASTSESPLHVPVGVDALMLVDADRGFASFEDAAAFVTEFICGAVGRPRPLNVPS
jgi:hypothetical protein